MASPFEVFKNLYEEGKYSEALSSLKAVIREKKKIGKGAVRFTEEEASFLWASAQAQDQAKNYEYEAELYDYLFQDMAYVKSHLDEVVLAGLLIAYNENEEERDFAKGMGYFEKAATCNPPSSAAMKHLGFMHEYGHGVEVDRGKALSYYKQSAEGGYPEGCYCFGVHYYNLIQANNINPENLEKAAIWLERAAELGYNGDAELTKKRFECWNRWGQFHLTQFNESMRVAAHHKQHVQTCADKVRQIQIELTGNMAAQSGPEVVTPAETLAVVDSVALANLGSEKEKEKGKEEEVAPQPDNSAARALTGGAGTFKREAKARSAANKTPSPNTDSKQNEALGTWNVAGKKGK